MIRILEQELPVFPLTEESATKFIYPPKPVYPSRYALVTKESRAASNKIDELDLRDFPSVELVRPAFFATWQLSGSKKNMLCLTTGRPK
jgi:hypothetical protein